MIAFIFGDRSSYGSSAKEYISNALILSKATKVLLDGLSRVSIIASQVCRKNKIPYFIFLPNNVNSPLSKRALDSSQGIIHYKHFSKTNRLSSHKETVKHMLSTADVIIYPVKSTKGRFTLKTLKIIITTKKPHLIIPV